MIVTLQNRADFEKYFCGTIVKFTEEGEILYEVKKFLDNHLFAAIAISGPNKGETVAVDITNGYEISYVLPRKTVFQNREHSFLLSRIPARMWKKGCHSSNTSFQYLTAQGLWKNCSFHIAYLISFTETPKIYPKYNEVLLEKLESLALSSRLSISKSKQIFIDRDQVGKIENNILYVYPLFRNYVNSIFNFQFIKDM